MSQELGTGSLATDGRRSIAGAVISNAATFLVALLIARLSGEALLGAFAILFALRAIIALICGLGMRIAMTKFVAASRARADFAELRGAVRVGVGATLSAAILAGAVLALLAPVLADSLFDQPSMTGPLRIVALSLPFAVLQDVTLAGTQGFQSMRAFARIGMILEPLCRLGFAALSLVAGWGLMGLAGGLLAASMIGGLSGAVVLARRVRLLPPTDPVHPWRRLAGFAGISWVASMATQGILWVDVVLLGAMVATEDVGVYQVATRAVMACMIVITPLTASMAPRIAHHWETRELDRLTRQLQRRRALDLAPLDRPAGAVVRRPGRRARGLRARLPRGRGCRAHPRQRCPDRVAGRAVGRGPQPDRAQPAQHGGSTSARWSATSRSTWR